MSDGKGCICHAYYSGECACDADWTPSEVYKLKDEIQKLRQALEFYGDENNYKIEFKKEEMMLIGAEVWADNGNIARTTLGEK